MEKRDEHSFASEEMRTQPTYRNVNPTSEEAIADGKPIEHEDATRSTAHRIYSIVCVITLFLNYFLSQYDKFILSYFQTDLAASLNLTSTQYATLSGYATGIVYALLALPVAFVADYLPSARVWILTIAALWWSLCVIFQGLSDHFWQILLARIGMGIGQSAVEALSLSLISDLVGDWRNVFVAESAFYIGVYIGEAVSGQIATAFSDTDSGWRVALKAIGITGIVISVVLRLVIRDPGRRVNLLQADANGSRPLLVEAESTLKSVAKRLHVARGELRQTVAYLLCLNSFGILVVSASFRQLAGNVFGYYMPSYLESIYPDKPNILSRYGIIVGVVGSVTVLAGGVITSLFWKRTKLMPIYLVSIGGMISSLFVLLMIFSRDIADGSQDIGIKILYGTMSIAYLTAEAWLGCVFGLIALLLPPRFKTFGLAIWSSIQVLIYSAGPEIIGLATRTADPASPAYIRGVQVALAVIIPVGYWLAGIGFLAAIPSLKRDLRGEFPDRPSRVSRRRRLSTYCVLAVIVAMTVALFVVDVVYDAMG